MNLIRAAHKIRYVTFVEDSRAPDVRGEAALEPL